jgi:hypothetical protein
MRNLLALIGAALVAFVGAGWYLGWYQVDSTGTGAQRKVSIEVDGQKISSDLEKGSTRVQQALDSKLKSSDDANKPDSD